MSSTPPSDAVGDFRYQGMWTDPAVGVYYVRSRSYDPTSGMFLSRDRALSHRSDFLLNASYAFADGNPLLYRDPSGNTNLVEVNATVATLGALAGATFSGISYYRTWQSGRISTAQYLVVISIGGATGALATVSAGGSVGGAAAASALTGGLASELNYLLAAAATCDEISYVNVTASIVAGAGWGFIFGGVAYSMLRNELETVATGGWDILRGEAAVATRPNQVNITFNARLNNVSALFSGGASGIYGAIGAGRANPHRCF